VKIAPKIYEVLKKTRIVTFKVFRTVTWRIRRHAVRQIYTDTLEKPRVPYGLFNLADGGSTFLETYKNIYEAIRRHILGNITTKTYI
jgi:hypothetical protein